MKWMGGWSYEDLIHCPEDYYIEIVRLINEEMDRDENG